MHWIPLVCMSTAIFPKNHSSHKTGMQHIISIILQHCSLTAKNLNKIFGLIIIILYDVCYPKTKDNIGNFSKYLLIASPSFSRSYITPSRNTEWCLQDFYWGQNVFELVSILRRKYACEEKYNISAGN